MAPRILAWIDDHDGNYTASYVSQETLNLRLPARRQFPNREHARRWIMEEAQELSCVVKWLNFDEQGRAAE
jgi:hypothetical protein